jgi:hypothetical protein
MLFFIPRLKVPDIHGGTAYPFNPNDISPDATGSGIPRVIP